MQEMAWEAVEDVPPAACRLTRALQTFELRPSYEDVLPAESASVEEYLEQLHELTTVAAIQASPCRHAGSSDLCSTASNGQPCLPYSHTCNFISFLTCTAAVMRMCGFLAD